MPMCVCCFEGTCSIWMCEQCLYFIAYWATLLLTHS